MDCQRRLDLIGATGVRTSMLPADVIKDRASRTSLVAPLWAAEARSPRDVGGDR
jgi:hypothetical protein